MSALFKQPEWNIEETVLLALASEESDVVGADTEVIVKKLSERLRSGAQRLGLSIGPRYRNEDEVKAQIKHMTCMLKMVGYIENEYFEGSTIGHVALLSKTNRERFNNLLAQAIDIYPTELSLFDEEDFAATENAYVETVRTEQERDSQSTICSDLPENEVSVEDPRPSYRTEKKRRPRIPFSNSPNHRIDYAYNNIDYDKKSNYTSHSIYTKESNNRIKETPILKPQGEEANSKRTNPRFTYDKLLETITNILELYFSKGFRLNSIMELKRFRTFYKSLYNKSLGLSDDSISDFIRKTGFEFDGKIYLVKKVISSELADKIISYIQSTFETKRRYVFFEEVWRHFEEELEYSQIANEKMLATYLIWELRNKYLVTVSYVAKNEYVKISVRDEVYSYVESRNCAISLEELLSSLYYLPIKSVEQEWKINDGRLISNGRNEKFHIRSFNISQDQIDQISNIISTTLSVSPFITADALLNELRHIVPELFSNNECISEFGIRNALAYHLGRKYSFRNNIISDIVNGYDGVAAILEYCRSKQYFTLQDLENVATVIGTPINTYLENILHISVRINNKEFVPRKVVNFDIEAIDKILDTYVQNDYLPIKAIENFDAFPSCGEYAWNTRVLESYLISTNSRFAYLHPTNLGKESVAGAIVKKRSDLKRFEDVLIQALGESDTEIEEKAANQYLYDLGLISRRQKNGHVKNILLKARECRNRINLKK